MSDHDKGLGALFSPRSIALVGASDNVARIGGRPLRYLRDSGFSGLVYPINPNRDTVQGLPAFASVAALPDVPDLALLALPAAQTVQAVEECAARGVKGAIVFSAGFAETSEEGRLAQLRMAQIAREGNMRLLGPNCLGAADSETGFYGTFSVMLDKAFLTPGPVAVVSQSGAYGSHIAHMARDRGMGIRHWITTGNESDVDVAEALRWIVDQPDVNTVMAYAEGVRNRDLFVEALDLARQREKAIIFMKVGRSAVGAHAVASHTAALAGADNVFDAILRQYGAYRARSTAEQLDVAYACAQGVYPATNRLGIFTMSGGFGIQMADDAEDAGLDVAPMPDAAQAELKALLPYASPVNPVDATAQVVTDLPLMTKYIRAVLELGDYAMFAGIFGSIPASPTYAAALPAALDEATAGLDNVIRAITMTASRDVARIYEERGFLIFEDGTALTVALGALAGFRRSFDDAKARAPLSALPAPATIGPRPLSEHGAKAILAQAGIPFPAERLAAPGVDVGDVAEQVGFPVVLKICSPDIAHKTEVGGVVVGVADAAKARTAAAAMLERVGLACPDAEIEGILVCPMVDGGIETIAGIMRDPVFGPVVMFGLGGILVEVLKDVTFRAAPFDADEAKKMIGDLRAREIFDGVRGAKPADIDALADTLAALSRFAAANADTIESVDINPLRVMEKGQGVRALDALISVQP
jgi:acyl-CoA synthetase (NDP forming)